MVAKSDVEALAAQQLFSWSMESRVAIGTI
jgi:hypothetical protein